MFKIQLFKKKYIFFFVTEHILVHDYWILSSYNLKIGYFLIEKHMRLIIVRYFIYFNLFRKAYKIVQIFH